MSIDRCPACGAAWAQVRVLKRYPMYGRCRCGMVGRVGAVTEDYGDDYFDTEDPNHGHRDFTSAWATEYDRRRFTVELDRVGPPRGDGQLLDVGAATGGFLALAREQGWRVSGVEPSEGARRLADERGINLVADVADVPADDRFELVTLHHVVEHLEDPVDVLGSLRERLSSSGRILIEVPNWHSTERMASGGAWVDLRPEQHRWHFTPATLGKILRLAGYEVIEIDTLGDPMPSTGTILLSIGIPLPVMRALRPGASGFDAGPIELPIRAETSLVSRAASLVDRPIGAMRLGKRLLVIAAPQGSTRKRAEAVNITAP